MKSTSPVHGNVGTEAMLDTLASDGVVALLPSARAALEDWRVARTVESEPSHRTLVLRDDLARYFGLTDKVEYPVEFDTYEF